MATPSLGVHFKDVLVCLGVIFVTISADHFLPNAIIIPNTWHRWRNAKALNTQIVTAQLNLSMSWSLT